MSKRKNNKQKKLVRKKTIENPCPSVNEECLCTEDLPCDSTQTIPTPENNPVRIYGKVKYNGQCVHLATVTIIRNRQVIAECLTDCEGCYEFNCSKGRYFLRAHKNSRRSILRPISCNNNGKFEINFCLH